MSNIFIHTSVHRYRTRTSCKKKGQNGDLTRRYNFKSNGLISSLPEHAGRVNVVSSYSYTINYDKISVAANGLVWFSRRIFIYIVVYRRLADVTV